MLPIQQSNLYRPVPLLNLARNLDNLRASFNDTDAARQHQSNVTVAKRLRDKVNDNHG